MKETFEAIKAAFDEAVTLRRPYESDWRESALFCLPRHFGRWQMADGGGNAGDTNNGQVTARRRIYDTTAVRALPKYASVLERMLTPQQMKWHSLKAGGGGGSGLMKIRAVQLYFEELNRVLFQKRYAATSNFITAQGESYLSLGCYGTGVKYIAAERVNPDPRYGRSLYYRGVSLVNTYVLLDSLGRVSSVFRRLSYNARQCVEKFGEANARKSMAIKAELDKGTPSERNYFEIVHAVCPREGDQIDPERLDSRGFPFFGVYMALKDTVFLNEVQGFLSLPFITPRTFTAPEEPYGFSPAQQALGAAGGVNAMKKTVLRQGQKAVDPPLLTYDDGVLNNIDLRPGAQNPGGLDSQGRQLVQALVTGNFQVAEKLIEDDREDIKDAFFVTLFQILIESPEMTATEVMQRTAERASLIAPTMGRLQTEDLAPTIGREIDVLADLGQLPQMPPELQEAQGEYEIEYASPLAKSQRAEEAAGFMGWTDSLVNFATAAQDPSALDWIDMDAAAPEIAEISAVPFRWVRTSDAVAGMREGRAKAQQDAQATEAAGPAAQLVGAVSKAQQAQGAMP